MLLSTTQTPGNNVHFRWLKMLNRGFLELVDAAYSEDGAVEDIDVECDILNVIGTELVVDRCILPESRGSNNGNLMVKGKLLLEKI
jgi:hypothetical protein